MYIHYGCAAYQDTIYYRLQPNVQVHVGAFLYTNQGITHLSGCLYNLVEGFHRSGTVHQIFD